MEHIYNDYQILSPNIMEKIAKEYNSINIKDNCNQIENDNTISDNDNYVEILSDIDTIYNNITLLKMYCSKNFYYKKEVVVNSILKTIEGLFDKLNYKPSNSKSTTFKNYCEIVTNCINLSVDVLDKLLKIFIVSSNKSEVHNIYYEFINVIKEIVSLIGVCRYRRFF